jgi:hypothetical protein
VDGPVSVLSGLTGGKRTLALQLYADVMETYRDDNAPEPGGASRGCLSLFGLIFTLLLSGCLVSEVRDRQMLRSELPPQLEPSFFVHLRRCSRVFGGYSYVVRISPEAAARLERTGPAWLAQADDYAVKQGGLPGWRPMRPVSKSAEFPPPGLQCSGNWQMKGQRIDDELYRQGNYFRSYHPRQGDYIIPSLGVVVGGFDPR